VKLEEVSPDTLSLREDFVVSLSSLSISLSNSGPALEDETASYDDQVELGFEASGGYIRHIEKHRYGLKASANLGFNPDYTHTTYEDGSKSRDPTPASSESKDQLLMAITPSATVDFRLYLFPRHNQLFLSAFTDVSYSYDYYYEKQGDADPKELNGHSFDLNVSAGAGYGRVLDTGPSLMLKKLEQYLLRREIIRRPLGRDVGNEILLGWYSLRNERGHFRKLQHIVEVLTRYDLLQKPLGLEGIYIIHRIMTDWYIHHYRREGWIIRAAFDASARVEDQEAEDESSSTETQESWLGAYLYFEYAKTLYIDGDLGLEGLLYFDLGEQDSPYAWMTMTLSATYRQYLFNASFDSLGLLSLGTDLTLRKAFTDQLGKETSHLYRFAMGSRLNSPNTHWLYMTLSSSVTYSYSVNRFSTFSVGVLAALQVMPDSPRDTLGYTLSLQAGVSFGVWRGQFSRY